MSEVEQIERRIWQTVQRWDMCPAGCLVVVGCSGGADSSALLHWLCAQRQALGVRVLAAHMHHGLRGAEADRDEAATRALCARLQVPLELWHEDVRAQAQASGEGLEACGRRLRYAFFARLCRQYATDGAARIATAHTLSDNAETVLLHLARGAGARGLSGIAPRRGRVVRPLIQLSRREVETYCAQYRLPYVTDSTNADTRFSRNRLRLRVVPELEALNPRFLQAAGRASQSLREDADFLDALAATALRDAAAAPGCWDAAALAQLARPLRLRALLQAAQAGGAAPESRHLQALEAVLGAGGAVALPHGVQARVQRGLLFFVGRPAGEWALPLAVPETVLPDGRRLCLRLLSRLEWESQKKNPGWGFSNALDYDTIANDTIVRNRRAGDVFYPAGRHVGKSLKKLWAEAGVPAPLRAGLLLLEGGGRLLWAQGGGPAEGAQVRAETRRVALLWIKERKNEESNAGGY